MSQPYTFAIDKVSFTSPPSVPIGTPFKRLAWAHQSGEFTLVLRPSEYHISLEIKGPAEPFNRTIPNTASRRIVNRPTITHDDRKIMFKYDWPIHPPATPGHLQERFQIVLKVPAQMPSILRLLSTHFDTTRSGSSQNRQTPQDTSTSEMGRRPESQESQPKRQKTDEIFETQMLPSHITAQSGSDDKSAAARMPLSILETEPTRSFRGPSVSHLNLSSHGAIQPTLTLTPTMLIHENSRPGHPSPEGETSDGRTVTPTNPGSDGVKSYTPLNPTPLTPQAGERKLINLDSPLAPHNDTGIVGVRPMPHSPSDLIGLETHTTEQEEDEADQELGGKFPPLQPPLRNPNNPSRIHAENPRPDHDPHAPDAPAGPPNARETHIPGTIGKGIYDMSEAEVERQIESALHERGFLDLVEKVGAILTKRQFVQDQVTTPQPTHQASSRRVQQSALPRQDHMQDTEFSKQVWHQGQASQDPNEFAEYRVWERENVLQTLHNRCTTMNPDDGFEGEMDSV